MPSTAKKLRAALLLALLTCGLPISALAADAPLPEFPAPTSDNVAAVQARFDAQATPETVDAAIDVVQKLKDADEKAGAGKIDVAACRAQAAALDAASRHDPVSLAVWYYKQRCAQALGDATEAARSEQAFAAVLRQMLAGIPPDGGRTSIGLYATADGSALIDASGEAVVYSYFDLSDLSAGLRWRVGLRDPGNGHERELSFDLLRNRLKLVHAPNATDTPWLWMSASTDEADEFFRRYTQSDGLPTTLDALGALAPERRAALIAQFAAREDLSSALVLNRYCVARADAACTGKTVDRLLDYAEKGRSQAMLALAYAYVRGKDIKHDEVSARTLLLGAAKTLGTGVAFAHYADLDASFAAGTGELPQWALQQLLVAADKGDALAAGVALQLLASSGELSLAPARVDALRAQVRAAGLACMEQHYLFFVAARTKDWPTMVRAGQALYAMRAPAGDHLAVFTRLWLAYLDGSHAGMAPDPALAMQWARSAGMDGNVVAMRYVGLIHADRAHDADSLRLAAMWLSAAMRAGDAPSMFAIARLAEGDYPALASGGGTKRLDAQMAVQMYRTFAAAAAGTPEAARARRALANLMFDGHGTQRDAPGARALLEHDAAAGDADSALALAQASYRGRFGVPNAVAAKRWLDKALAKPNAEVSVRAADALFRGVDLPADRARAFVLWAQAAGQGYASAWNEMAWELCTATDSAARDSARGLQTIARIAPAERTAAEIDTVAACQAASGDFSAAIASQQAAIARVDPQSDTAARMRDRLMSYQAHRPYVMPVEKMPTVPQEAAPVQPAKKI